MSTVRSHIVETRRIAEADAMHEARLQLSREVDNLWAGFQTLIDQKDSY